MKVRKRDRERNMNMRRSPERGREKETEKEDILSLYIGNHETCDVRYLLYSSWCQFTQKFAILICFLVLEAQGKPSKRYVKATLSGQTVQE